MAAVAAAGVGYNGLNAAIKFHAFEGDIDGFGGLTTTTVAIPNCQGHPVPTGSFKGMLHPRTNCAEFDPNCQRI